MDQDLEKLQAEILAKEEALKGGQSAPPSQPVVVQVAQPATTQPAPIQPVTQVPTGVFQAEVEKPKNADQVGEVVEKIFTQAVVHTVANDDPVKENLLRTAKQVVIDKTDAIKFKVEKESKEAYFDNNKAACEIFGYDEKTTAKSHVKIMKFWAYLLNSIYIFTIGFFIVSPICFICKKLKVVIKHVWVAAILALVIYLAIVGLPILIGYLTSLG